MVLSCKNCSQGIRQQQDPQKVAFVGSSRSVVAHATKTSREARQAKHHRIRNKVRELRLYPVLIFRRLSCYPTFNVFPFLFTVPI